MAPSNSKREETIELLRGPVMEVTVTSSSSDTAAWGLPKALLSHHSGYFQRATRPCTFRESEDNKVTLEDFEPEVFKLFIEFMYYGRYTYRDDLADKLKVRDSAKAWVLGDYLDAVEFKNFAMRNLYDIYFPANGEPKTGIGPAAIEHCCSATLQNSPLQELYLDCLVVYWHDIRVILYDPSYRSQWDEIWDRHRELRNEILYYTNQAPEGRLEKKKTLDHYFAALSITDEPDVSSL
ncbi:hypothetical protein BKA63DRAFT_270785 [Paraphoma chrysanthemicola]|nr:hypothetical protein BKA63DRAFT_270785 [Paraphoma chrysanthemicola]